MILSMNMHTSIEYFMNMPLYELCAFVEDYNSIIKSHKEG